MRQKEWCQIMTNRVMSMNGCRFENGVFYKGKKRICSLNEIKEDIIESIFDKKQGLILCYNKNELLYFKRVYKKDFERDFESLVYIKEHAHDIDIAFRLTTESYRVLMGYPDIIPPISQRDISKWLYENQPIYKVPQLGGFCEYCLSGNINDFVNPNRKKAHDVWIGGQCFEVKSSLCGFKLEKQANNPLNLWLWDVKSHQIKAMRESYSISNGFYKIEV